MLGSINTTRCYLIRYIRFLLRERKKEILYFGHRLHWVTYAKLPRRFIPLRFKEFVCLECCFLSSLSLLTSSVVHHPLISVCLGFHLFVNWKNLLNMKTLPLLLSFLLLDLAVLSTAILFVFSVLVSILVSVLVFLKKVRRLIKFLGQEWGFVVVVAPNLTHDKARIFGVIANSTLFHQLYLSEEWRLIGPVFYAPRLLLFSSFQTQLWSYFEALQTLSSFLKVKFNN